MGFFGKLLSTPVRLLNVPARVMEKLVDDDDLPEDRIMSKPLERIAQALEEIDED